MLFILPLIIETHHYIMTGEGLKINNIEKVMYNISLLLQLQDLTDAELLYLYNKLEEKGKDKVKFIDSYYKNLLGYESF